MPQLCATGVGGVSRAQGYRLLKRAWTQIKADVDETGIDRQELLAWSIQIIFMRRQKKTPPKAGFLGFLLGVLPSFHSVKKPSSPMNHASEILPSKPPTYQLVD